MGSAGFLSALEDDCGMQTIIKNRDGKSNKVWEVENAIHVS